MGLVFSGHLHVVRPGRHAPRGCALRARSRGGLCAPQWVDRGPLGLVPPAPRAGKGTPHGLDTDGHQWRSTSSPPRGSSRRGPRPRQGVPRSPPMQQHLIRSFASSSTRPARLLPLPLPPGQRKTPADVSLGITAESKGPQVRAKPPSGKEWHALAATWIDSQVSAG